MEDFCLVVTDIKGNEHDFDFYHGYSESNFCPGIFLIWSVNELEDGSKKFIPLSIAYADNLNKFYELHETDFSFLYVNKMCLTLYKDNRKEGMEIKNIKTDILDWFNRDVEGRVKDLTL